jgi:hypothetical protein
VLECFYLSRIPRKPHFGAIAESRDAFRLGVENVLSVPSFRVDGTTAADPLPGIRMTR